MSLRSIAQFPFMSGRGQSRGFAIPLLIIALCGCGRQKHPVTGVVVYEDGTPYAGGGIVAMEAEIDGKRAMARGGIGTDGRFLLASERPEDGACEATYRVRVLPPVVVDGGGGAAAIPRKFQAFETSGLTFDVRAGTNDFTITLGPKLVQ